MKATAYEKGKMKKMYAPNKKVKIWIYIVSIFLVLLYLLPIYVMLNQSFRYITDLTPRLYFPEKWTLENYAQALFESDLFIGFKNSIVYVIEVCVIEVVLGGLAAYGLARAGGKISTALRTFNICIMMIPSLSLLVGTYSLMVKFHMINKIWALSLQTAAIGMAGTMFFYTSFIISIPKDLDEAAAIDGAGIFRTFFQDYSASAEAGYSDASDYDSSWNLEQFCNANLLADRHDKSDRYHDGSKSFLHGSRGCAECAAGLCRMCDCIIAGYRVIYSASTIYYRGTVGLRK